MIIRKLITCFVSVGLTACATTHRPPNPIDPLEAFNRQSFQFDQDLDTTLIQPLAKAYHNVIPAPIRTGIYNVFSNLNEIPTVANDLLQVNPYQALSDTARFALNSSFGIAGIFDVATKANLPKHSQDFGLTLARWGWRQSAYLVLPFWGFSTIRDGLSIPINTYLTIYPYMHNYAYPVLALNFISERASLLGSEMVVEQAAIDPYVFFRNAYLQRRDTLIQHNDRTLLSGNYPYHESSLTDGVFLGHTPGVNTANNQSIHISSTADSDADILRSIDAQMPQH